MRPAAARFYPCLSNYCRCAFGTLTEFPHDRSLRRRDFFVSAVHRPKERPILAISADYSVRFGSVADLEGEERSSDPGIKAEIVLMLLLRGFVITPGYKIK